VFCGAGLPPGRWPAWNTVVGDILDDPDAWSKQWPV
jgi:hypothetical protein